MSGGFPASMAEPPWPELRSEALLKRLADADIDFVVIGGMARTLLGSPRVTKDLDICPSRDRDNLKSLGQALRAIEARPRGFPAELPFVADERTIDSASILTLETTEGWVDLLLEPAGWPGYGRLRENAELVDIDGRVVRVAAIEDLIAMKRAAGRPQDIADIAELELLQSSEPGSDQ